jgi:hypothetical protein
LRQAVAVVVVPLDDDCEPVALCQQSEHVN